MLITGPPAARSEQNLVC